MKDLIANLEAAEEGTRELGRFFNKVAVRGHEDCWEWRAHLNHNGYGVFWFGNKNQKAHRVVWQIFRGCIPQGILVLHRCDNRKCVNPKHLFLGTHSDNARDMVDKGRNRYDGLKGRNKTAQSRTHCKNGHPLSGDNLKIDANGTKCCRICGRAYSRQYYLMQRAKGLR